MVYGCTVISLQRGVLNRDIIDGFSTVLDLKLSGDIKCTLWVYDAAYMDRVRSAAQNL